MKKTWNFSILLSGYSIESLEPEWNIGCPLETLDCDSLHVYGRQERSEKKLHMLKHYSSENMETFEHSEGHEIPRSEEFAQIMHDFISTRIEAHTSICASSEMASWHSGVTEIDQRDMLILTMERALLRFEKTLKEKTTENHLEILALRSEIDHLKEVARVQSLPKPKPVGIFSKIKKWVSFQKIRN